MAPSRTSKSSINNSSVVPVTPSITRSRKTSTLNSTVEVPQTTSRSKLPWNSTSTSISATPRGINTPASKPLWSTASKSNALVEPNVIVNSRLSKVVVNNNQDLKKSGTISNNITPPMTPGKGLGIQMEKLHNDKELEDFLKSTTVDFGTEKYEPSREPIKTYLRVRPASNGSSSRNYIQTINNSEVLMVPPEDHRLNPASISSSFLSGPLLRANLTTSGGDASPIGTVYKFTKVFSPSPIPSTSTQLIDDTQSTFFKETSLPLVHDFLNGQNCLLFAYGPTGSGKTWTVQGGEGEKAGLLPRVMDVVWRSLQGRETKSNLRPTMVAGVEATPISHHVKQSSGPMSSTPNKFFSSGLGVRPSLSDDLFKKAMAQGGVPEIVQVDDAYEYSIWVSYAEIYNEKIYDLLESPLPTPSTSSSSSTHSATPSSVFQAGLGLLSVGGAKAKGFMRGFTTVKRNALTLKHDVGAGNKYVHGMKEIRVHSAEEARSLLDRGQTNRRVFSTLSNRVSSRSHSVFTIKIIRIRKGANPEDPASASSSRFSIVDLAGSERVVNTQTTGERLKEAGNINKSLMVLGQCMEVLRKNQERGGKKPAIVPFRHSKLTELFQSFFVGDGKAVMIVNVNPYETGFDENSHVMKFSAVAKGMMTIKAPTAAPTPVVYAPVTPVAKPVRIVRMSMVAGGEEEDIIYEEDDDDLEFGEDDQEDEFVNALLEELTVLRTALYESQIEKIMAESEVRTRTVKEYEQKLVDMEKRYQEKMREEADHAQTKLNAKLDLLTRLYESRAAASASASAPSTPSNYDDSDDDLQEEEEEEEEEEEDEEEEQDESRETDDASADVEAMLLEDDRVDRSMAAEDSPLSRAHGRAGSEEVLTPSRTLASIIAAHNLEDTVLSSEGEATEVNNDGEGEEEEEEDEDDEVSLDEQESFDSGMGESSLEIEEVESDEYEEDEDEEEELSSSEDEYVPAPRASMSGRLPRGSNAALKQDLVVKKKSPVKKVIETINLDVVVEVQAKVRKGTPVRSNKLVKENGENEPLVIMEEDDEEEEILVEEEEDQIMSKPISASKAKKPKRKLGGVKVRDVEELESITEALAPLPKSISNISIASSSIRSSFGSIRSPLNTR